MTFDANAVLTRVPNTLGIDIDQEHVLTDTELNYHGLDRIGRRVWQLMANPTTLGTIAEQLSEEFEVTPEQAVVDVAPFLEELRSRNLIVIGE